MTIFETVKELIFIDQEITASQEKLLNTIVDLTTKKLLSKLQDKEVPEQLEHIVIEVSIIRYNRLGSEGMSKESQDGRSIEFSNNDFKDFEDEIADYLNGLNKNTHKSRVRFLWDLKLM